MPTARLLLVALVSALTGAAAMAAVIFWYFDPFDAHGRPADSPVQTAIPAPSVPPAPAAVGSTGHLLVPVTGVDVADITDTFGDPRGAEGERRHQGIDIMAPAGTPVVAVADGRIDDIFMSEAGGLTLTLHSGSADYFYGHLSAYAPGLAEGQAVRAGDRLGAVGSTGNADAAAPHLHFEMRLLGPDGDWDEGRAVNPLDYLKR